MNKIILATLLAVAAFSASAEKADVSKQTIIDYDNAVANQVTQTVTLTGNVVVTKGTLLLKAETAVYRDADGGINVVLTAAPGKLATFRQKRDGGPDLWSEGEAQRIEYDERTSLLKLFGAARIRQLEGTRVTDETQSAFISYDSMREVFVSRNDPSGASKVGGGRSRMIFAPRKPRPAPDAPAAGTEAPTP